MLPSNMGPPKTISFSSSISLPVLSLLLASSVALFLLAFTSGCGDLGSELATPDPEPPAPDPPEIHAITPDSATFGDTLRVAGLRFGNAEAVGEVRFQGAAPTARVQFVAAPIVSWSDTLIDAVVPDGATSGPVVVVAGGRSSNGVSVMVADTPAPPALLVALVPVRTVIGDTVRVIGENLGVAQETRRVLFTAPGGGTVEAPVVAWGADTVRVLVPAGAADGEVVVEDAGSSSNGLPFEVAPALVSFATEVHPLLGGDHPEYGCYGCHEFEGGSGNFDTRSWETIMSGTSDHGPAVTPRHGGESVLVKKLRGTATFGTRMPPPPTSPMTEAHIQLIADWIDQGARNN